MIELDNVVNEVFYKLSEKIESDQEHREKENIINQLMTLEVDKATLIEIDKAIFIAEMRAIEIACKEAFIYGLEFQNQII